jgi:Domain of Unknown Function with PDB structure (DUF3857)/Transglutaminase-like superfamily
MFTSLSQRLFLRLLLTLFLFGILNVASAQTVWRPVSPGELAIKTPTVEPDADAEAIFWEIRIDDKKDSKLFFDHYVRVKIFTDRGREKFSKFDIPFYKGRKITNVAARIVKPDGSSLEIAQADIFEREIIKANKIKVMAKSFAVTGIEPGVILEYKYREEVKNDSLSGERLQFQRDIPVQKLTYFIRPYQNSTIKPEYFNIPQDVTFDKAEDNFQVATRLNVPSFKEEPRMPPEDTVRSWIMLQYTNFFGTSGWSQMAIGFQYAMKDLMKANNDVKKIAAEVTVTATNDEDKVRKLYEFSQKQIKNLSFDQSLTDEQREKAYAKNPGETLKRRAGTSENVDLLFASMASSLGFEARIVLSGNRNEFFFDPQVNSHRSFVHPACVTVKIGGKFRYFNPGSPYLAFEQLVWYEELVPTILVGENNWVMGTSPLSDETVSLAKRKGKFRLLEDGTLEGDATIEYNGQQAIDRRRVGFLVGDAKRLEDYKDEIKQQMPNAEISNVAITNFEQNSLPLIYSFQVKILNYAQKTGKRLFLQPGFFEYGEKPVFSNAKRIHPIYFRYPWSEDDTVEIEFPKNFQVDTLDQPSDIADPAKIGSLAITIQPNADKTGLNYTRKFYFGKGQKILFPATVYAPLKNLFDIFHRSNNHTITLKQK